MAFKCIALFALIAVASAQHYYEPHHVVKQVVPIVKKVVEHEAPANYDFEYAVHDDHTGDVKEQHESAKDGAISGFYSLIDADGYKRIVHYTADDHNGFVAEVKREPIHDHKYVKEVAPVVVKKVVAAPVVHKYVHEAPQYYSAPAPAQQQYYSAPAPVHKYVAAPIVAKVAAPAPYTHVSFNGPSSNYHY